MRKFKRERRVMERQKNIHIWNDERIKIRKTNTRKKEVLISEIKEWRDARSVIEK